MTELDIEDPRVVYLKSNVLNLLHTDSTPWDEMIWKEDNQAVIKEFFDVPSSSKLIFFFDFNKKLVASLEVPAAKTMPNVVVYFLKNNVVISSENFKNAMMFGSLGSLPLFQFLSLFDKVLYPMFGSEENNERWPKEIAMDISNHFEDFQKTLTYHVGIAKKKTFLVFSEEAKLIENFELDEISSCSNDWRVHSVIKAVTDMLCNWISIVKEVIDLTSEEILEKNHQGPSSEIIFWNDRKANLKFIQDQLNEPLVEKMVLVLEKCRNEHYHLFKRLLQDVSEALAEASEISKSLSNMSTQLSKLEDADFPELTEKIPPTIEIMTSSWDNSEYFNKVPSRIAVLLKKMCYFLMEKVQKFLNPSNLFKSNRNKMNEKVKVTIDACDVFLDSYSVFQEVQKYPWQFPDKRVFDFFYAFLDRLKKISDLFEASEIYSSIPDYKMLGIQQALYKSSLDDLSASFEQSYRVFIESTYNPLDLSSNAFLEDYDVFMKKVSELDFKLGTTLAQACVACVTPENSFEIMDLVQDLLKRPIAEKEFRKLISSLLKNVQDELLTTNEKFEELNYNLENGKHAPFKRMPEFSAVIQWSLDLQKNIASPVESLKKVESYFINEDDADGIHKTFSETEEKLSRLQKDVLNKWETVLNSVKESLNETIFLKTEDKLALNFSHKILDAAEEIRCLKRIEKLPEQAKDIDGNLQNILPAYPLLACSCRWYSDLNEGLNEHEKMLVKEEWDKISSAFEKGFNMKWSNADLAKYSEDIYATTKSLFERINQAKENIRSVELSISAWKNSPVLVRSHSDAVVNLELLMTPKMRQKIHQALETSLIMTRVREENLELFQCDQESDTWKKYVIYLESIIEKGLKQSVTCSLTYLVENTDESNKKLTPFYKICMILADDISFIPPLDRGQLGNICTLLNAVFENIFRPAAETKRMTDPEQTYYDSIVDDNRVSNLKEKIMSHFQNGINKIKSKRSSYEMFAELWLQDIEAVLGDFVLFGPVVELKTEVEHDPDSESALELKAPTEEEFRTEISKFDLLYKKVEDMESEIQIESWLLLDVLSFKDTLLSMIRNWSIAYKRKLVEMKSQGKLRKLEEDSDL